MKSLSVGDRDAMLGVITMAVTDKTFKWILCSGEPCVAKEHITWNPPRGLDAPETLSLVTTPWYDPNLSEDEQSQTSQFMRTQEEIWDDSLKRGGSSIKIVNKFLLDEGFEEMFLGADRQNESEAITQLPSASGSTPSIWKPRCPAVESTIGDGFPPRSTLQSVPTTFKQNDIV